MLAPEQLKEGPQNSTFWLSDAHLIVSMPVAHKNLTSNDRAAVLLIAFAPDSIYQNSCHEYAI